MLVVDTSKHVSTYTNALQNQPKTAYLYTKFVELTTGS